MAEDKVKTDDSTKDGGSKDNQITLEVDGEKKTYGAEDVQNLIAQQASATQKTQKVAALAAAAEKYGLDPEEYVNRADGAFATVVQMIDEGVLDEQGKRIEKKDDKIDPTKVDPTKVVPTKEDKSKELTEALDRIDKMEKRTAKVEEDNINLMRKNLSRDIKKKHPSFNDDDVSRLIGIAVANQNKDVWQHAEEFAGKKTEATEVLRGKFAKEFGIKDLKEWDANKIKEQDAKGGGAAAVLGKRKISFNAKASDPNTVTPRRATIEFFKNVDRK